MEWLDNNIDYWHWLVLGLLLAAGEIFVPGFVLLWFGVGAIVVGLISYAVDLSFTVQLLIWIGLSVSDLLVWLKFVQPRLRDKSFSGMSREAMLGQEGMVIAMNVGERGRLRFPMPILGSDEWPFICDDDVRSGERVRVIDVSGNTLIVKKA